MLGGFFVLWGLVRLWGSFLSIVTHDAMLLWPLFELMGFVMIIRALYKIKGKIGRCLGVLGLL